MQYDLNGVRYPRNLRGDYLWPNELSTYKDRSGRDVMLISDGFLMPGQNDGGIYAIRDPESPQSKPVRITQPKEGWFYHRAMHVKLPGGSEGILSARATKPLLGIGSGELVWLSLPRDRSGLFDSRKSAYSLANSTCHLDEVILYEGPDVMFEVIDLDKKDDQLEIIAAHFFGRKLSIHSIRAKAEHPFIEVLHSSEMDTVGRPYGVCLATFNPPTESDESDGSAGYKVNGLKSKFAQSNSAGNAHSNRYSKRQSYRKSSSSKASDSSNNLNSRACHVDNMRSRATHILVSTHECNYDLHSAVNMAFSAMNGQFPKVKTNSRGINSLFIDPVSSSSSIDSPIAVEHSSTRLLTGLEYDPNDPSTINGGSLFAYELPSAPALKQMKMNSKTFQSSSATPTTTATAPATAISVAVSSAVEPQTNADRLDLSKWNRKTLFRGFKVRGWGGIFSPGAPGFPYVFNMPNKPQVFYYNLYRLTVFCFD